MLIRMKQIDLPPGVTSTAALDGATLDGTEAAELIAGKDTTGKAQFIATDTAGRVLVSDGSGSLTVDGSVTSTVQAGSKGATAAATVTSTTQGVDHQALDVQLYHAGSPKDPAQIRALTASDTVTAAQGAAGLVATAWPIKVTDGSNVATITNGALKVDSSGTTHTVSGTVTANVGTTGGLALDANITNGSQQTKITDGTNLAVISTAPTTADKGLVVAISPNSSIKQGPPASAFTNAWLFKLTDGVSGCTIKPGATVAAQGDTALVTALHPSSNTVKIADSAGNLATIKATSALSTDGALVTALHPLSNVIRLSDGTNTAAVKSGATPATFSDPAVVVAHSPNDNPNTSNVSNKTASTTSTTLVLANSNRKGCTIWNDSTATLYLKLGSGASATSCTVKLLPDAYYEVPFRYMGVIDGIWSAAAGSARITELT